MINVQIKDVCNYYKKSALYKELSEDLEDEDEITIDKKHYAHYPSLKNLEDFDIALENIRYWMFDEIPIQILNFVKNKKGLINTDKYQEIIKKYFDVPFIKGLAYKYENFNEKLGEYIVKSNDICLFKFLSPDFVMSPMNYKHQYSSFIVNAIKKNRLEIIKYAFQHNYELKSYYFRTAGEYGWLEILKYLYTIGSPPKDDKQILLKSMQNKHFECFKYVYEKGLRIPDTYWNKVFQRTITKTGSVEFIKYAYDNDIIVTDVSLEVAETGCLEGIMYLESIKKLTVNYQLFEDVVKSGRIESVTYLFNKYLNHIKPLQRTIYTCAIKSNNPKVLQFIIDLNLRFKFDSSHYIYVIEIIKDLDILKIIHNKVNRKPKYILEHAIRCCCPCEIIKFLLEYKFKITGNYIKKFKEHYVLKIWENNNDEIFTIGDDMKYDENMNYDENMKIILSGLNEKGKNLLDEKVNKKLEKIKAKQIAQMKKSIFTDVVMICDLDTVKLFHRHNIPCYDNLCYHAINRIIGVSGKTGQENKDIGYEILCFLLNNNHQISNEGIDLSLKHDIYSKFKHLIPQIDVTTKLCYHYIENNQFEKFKELYNSSNKPNLDNDRLTLGSITTENYDMIKYLHNTFGLTSNFYKYSIIHNPTEPVIYTLIKLGLELNIPKLCIKKNDYDIHDCDPQDNFEIRAALGETFKYLYDAGFTLDSGAYNLMDEVACVESRSSESESDSYEHHGYSGESE